MLAELMVEPVGRQFRYMFCFNNFAQEFKEQKENLVKAKERLQDDVEAAERNAEKTYKDVKKWLEDANNEIEGAKPLENEIGKNGKCFTWCPNCMRQFKLSKALATKSETFRKLGESSEKFTTVAQKAPPQPIEFLTSKEFTPSESSQEALEQIMKVLKDDNVNMIGLYGMGGVGKTTLVKEVGRRAKESQLFPEVLMATVSQNPNFIGIQDRMADSLHLKFEKTSKEGRASELWRKYDIILGNWFVVANYGYPTSTRLILAGTSLNAKTFEQLFLHKLESVQVSSCGDVFTLFPAKLRQGLKNLKEVIVDSCKSLEEVFELGEADEQSNEEKGMPLLSSLTELQLEMLPKLKCIWKGPTGHASLQSLNLLNLNHLDKLIFIFTPSLARSLPKLETLNIRNCGELKHIIREEDCDREIIPESPCFPKLKTISISDCGKLEYVLPVSVSPSLPNLEQMWILNAHNLKQIFYNVEGDALTRDGIIKFPELRELSISNCSFFGPKKFAAQLPSLQILEINGHKELGNLFAQLQVRPLYFSNNFFPF
jgi:Cdc6-like AAA superfamily ATPase